MVGLRNFLMQILCSPNQTQKSSQHSKDKEGCLWSDWDYVWFSSENTKQAVAVPKFTRNHLFLFLPKQFKSKGREQWKNFVTSLMKRTRWKSYQSPRKAHALAPHFSNHRRNKWSWKPIQKRGVNFFAWIEKWDFLQEPKNQEQETEIQSLRPHQESLPFFLTTHQI